MKFEEDWEDDFGIQYNINRTYEFYDIENLEYFLNILNDDGITYMYLGYSGMDIKETINHSAICVVVCNFYYYIMESKHYKRSTLSYYYPIDKNKNI